MTSKEAAMPNWLKTVLSVVVLTLILFALRVLARIPGSYLDDFYGIYAVFTAPFYAFVLAFYLKRWQRFYPLAIACVLFAAILFVLQPFMSADALIPLLAAAALYGFEARAGKTMQAVTTAFVFGALGYPVAVLTGMFCGSLDSSSSDYITQFMVLFIAGCALSIAGVTLALRLTRTR
jgi:hypothetical protein